MTNPDVMMDNALLLLLFFGGLCFVFLVAGLIDAGIQRFKASRPKPRGATPNRRR